jgi:hypothetical protein
MAKPQQDLAPNETRRIDGLQLAPLFREPMYALGSKRGYTQGLDLIWTRRKNHPRWDGVSPEEALGLDGQVVYASERAQTSSLIVGRLGQGEGSQTAGWSRLSLNQLRPRCLRAVFHEYAHALQEWPIGAHQSANDQGRSEGEKDYANSLESARRKHQALGKSAQEAYLATPREVDARQLADAALAQVKEDMADTRWDFLLPLTLIQAYSEGQ